MPILYSTSGFAARVRMVLEKPARRNYLLASYSKPVDVKKWAQSLHYVAELFHYEECM